MKLHNAEGHVWILGLAVAAALVGPLPWYLILAFAFGLILTDAVWAAASWWIERRRSRAVSKAEASRE